MAYQNNTQIQNSKEKPVTLDKQAALLSSQITKWITNNLQNPDMALAVPKGYNVGNEVSSLIFAISQTTDKNGNSAFSVCNPNQVSNMVKDCVVQGLSITKKHVWPIIYGGKLMLQMSYYGQLAALSYMFPDLQVYANVLYEGDSYDYCTDDIAGYNYITNVHSSIENRNKPIIAGYGNIVDKNTGKRVYGIVMSWAEIQKNWSKSRSKDNQVQRDFPQEMAKRTVISRLCKMYINSGANTNTEQVGAFNRMTEAEYTDVTPPQSEAEKQRMLRSRSRGTAGLEALLDETNKEYSENEAITEEGEIIQPTPENASEVSSRASERKTEKESANNGADSENTNASGDLLSDDIPF